jgi:hypothetical protein
MDNDMKIKICFADLIFKLERLLQFVCMFIFPSIFFIQKLLYLYEVNEVVHIGKKNISTHLVMVLYRRKLRRLSRRKGTSAMTRKLARRM